MYEPARVNWSTRDYFTMLLNADERSSTCLEMLVDDLHASKDRTIRTFLDHSGSEDFLWGLAKLLGHTNCRVSGNSAYILGTLAESEAGCARVISMATSANEDGRQILSHLNSMLVFDDCESVMNAAGTIGTLAESVAGRAWILQDACLHQLIDHSTKLLFNENLWIASNAALVLARLSIAEDGCIQIMKHDSSEQILAMLITSLGVDVAGRGMNSAFAIGRLCDLEVGRARLLSMPESETMILSLGNMLSCSDGGASKNACFALSCLATSADGHGRILSCQHSDSLLRALAELLSAADNETSWFAAMTLRTLASLPKGCIRLRKHNDVMSALKSIDCKSNLNSELTEEVMLTLSILQRLQKPSAPEAEVLGAHTVRLSWPEASTKSGLQIKYHVYEVEGSHLIHHGTDAECTVENLEAFVQYSFKLRASTEGDDSPFSDVVTVTTDESVPEAPQHLRILGCTTTQLKVGWEPPETTNGLLKGYYVHYGSSEMTTECTTTDVCMIITSLQPNTTYQVQVCAATSKGKGQTDSVSGTTSETGAHAPSRPEVVVRGRHELSVQWRPPEVSLGRISRYDLMVNGDVVYSGTELHYTVVRLRPDTEYTFVVSAITSEGRCESKPTKKKTAKDEYDGERAPLYPVPTPRALPEADVKAGLPAADWLNKRRSIGGLSLSSTEFPHQMTSTRSASASSVKSTNVRRMKSGKKRTTGTRQKWSRRQSLQTLRSAVDVKSEKPSDPVKTPTGVRRHAWELSLRSYTMVDQLPSDIAKRTPSAKCQNLKTDLKPVASSCEDRSSVVANVVAGPVGSGREDGPAGSGTAAEGRAPAGTTARPDVSGPMNPVRRAAAQRGGAAAGGGGEEGWHGGGMTHARAAVQLIDISSGLGCLKTTGKMRGAITPAPCSLYSRGDEWTSLKETSPQHSPTTQAKGERAGAGEGATQQEGRRARAGEQQGNNHVCPTLMKRHVLPVEVNISGAFEGPKCLSGYMELDLGSSVTGGRKAFVKHVVPVYVQRAKTFMGTHRPTTDRQSLQKLKACLSHTVQWQPELPASEHVQATHNKFVPMQMRTQPLNLPNGDVCLTDNQQAAALSALVFNRQPSMVAAGVGRNRTDIRWPAANKKDPAPRQPTAQSGRQVALSPGCGASARRVSRDNPLNRSMENRRLTNLRQESCLNTDYRMNDDAR